MDLNLTTPAVLFPAISLLMLAYTNRYLAISALIRELYNQFKQSQEQHLKDQIVILRRRLGLIRNMQFLGVLSFLLCVLCMLAIFENWNLMGTVLFALSLVLMVASLLLSAIEIQQSVHALDLQLRDLEDELEP